MYPERPRPAVADHMAAEFAAGRFDRRVRLAGLRIAKEQQGWTPESEVP